MRKTRTKKEIIQSGPIVRSRKSHKAYDSYRRSVKINEDCVFCNESEMKHPIRRGSFWVIENRFGYEVWDGCKVVDHKMVVPVRHVGSIPELDSYEKAEYIDLIGEYETNGYAIYSRSVNGATRSVVHLHTHLIKLDSKPIKRLIYLEKPHVLIYKR